MAEGGPGRSRNYRENRFGLRSRESARICKYYVLGSCSFGENCRFRHVDTNRRENLEEHSGLQVEQGEDRITSKPNVLSKPKEKSGDSVSDLRYSLGACSRSFRYVDTNRRENLEDHTGLQGEQGEDRITSKPNVLSKPKEKSGDSVSDLRYSLGACSRSSVEDWVNAPEFIPSGMDYTTKTHKTYAEAVSSLTKTSKEVENEASNASYLQTDEAYGPLCIICDICNETPLDPNNEEERRKHISECIKKHERDMELSFAIQRSKDKACGICFEVIMEKANGEQKFGILPNCNHSFCLSCIRKWRQAKHFDNKIIRSCPECRVSSDFVCPSIYWVESKEDKEKLIVDYKEALSAKDCKYFLKGRGKCPFGNKCFYKHAYPDGTKADVGPPVRQRRQNADGEIAVFRHIYLWDFLEDRDNRWAINLDELDDIFAFISDSDESDWSDFDYFL